MAEVEADDISADIRSAIEGLTTADPAPVVQADPVSDPGAQDMSAAPIKDVHADGRVRDESGRFAPKTDDKAAKSADAQPIAAQQPGPESPLGDITVPRSLSPAAKAAFPTWAPDVQQEFLRREADTARGVEKLQQELRTATDRYQPLDSILAPHRQEWQMAGISDDQFVGRLLAAHQALRDNPNAAIAYLAKQYGADPAAMAATPAPQADPQVQQLHNKIQTLEQRLQAQDQASRSHALNETLSTIEQFAQDPKHVYFDNVREDMGRLIESGAAASLPDAYQKACWSNETIRNLMLAEQQRGTQADEERRRQEHAAQARHAGGSVAGSAGPGANRALNSDPSASIDDDVRNAIRELAGRV